MSEQGGHRAIDLAWQRQRTWSSAANAAQATTVRGRRIGLALAITAAVAGAAATHFAGSSAAVALAFVASASIGLGTVAAKLTGRDAVQAATRLRAVSEALKAKVFAYLAMVEPYRGADRDEVLLREVDALDGSSSDLVGHVHDAEPDDQPLPAVRDVDSYVRVRAERQVAEYYRPKARRMSRNLRWSRLAELTFGVVGTLLVAATAVLEVVQLTVWIGVVTTVTTSILAHTTASRYEYLRMAYRRTEHELEALLARRRLGGTRDEDFVQACERVMALQNESWLAHWNSYESRESG